MARLKIPVRVDVDIDYLAETAVVAQQQGKKVQEVVNRVVEDALRDFAMRNQPPPPGRKGK